MKHFTGDHFIVGKRHSHFIGISTGPVAGDGYSCNERERHFIGDEADFRSKFVGRRGRRTVRNPWVRKAEAA